MTTYRRGMAQHPAARHQHQHEVSYDAKPRTGRWCPYCNHPSVFAWNAIVVAKSQPEVPVWLGIYYFCEDCGDLGYEQGSEAGSVPAE